MKSRQQRRFKHGVHGKYERLQKKLNLAKKNAVIGEKPKGVKTHLRNAIIMPEMCGSVVDCYGGKYWNSRYIVGRRRKIVLSIQIVICYYVFSYFPLQATKQLSSDNMNFVINASNLFCCSIGFSLMTLRIYLLYFDHEYNNRLSTQKWKILVDPEVGKNDWFLMNRHTKYGDERFIILRILTPLLIIYFSLFAALWFSLHRVHHNDAISRVLAPVLEYSFTGCIALMCAIFGVKFWIKYPNFNDNLLIRQEITNTLKLVGVYCLFQIA